MCKVAHTAKKEITQKNKDIMHLENYHIMMCRWWCEVSKLSVSATAAASIACKVNRPNLPGTRSHSQDPI